MYNKDVQGSTTNLLKDDGTADVSYRYDETTGLYYLNARYYNPEDGRFFSEDTYRGETNEPDTQHLYVYCADNPVNYVDPSGHKSMACIYYNAGHNLTKQAKNSPYYLNKSVKFKGVGTPTQFRNAWNLLTNGKKVLYMYIHSGFKYNRGWIYMHGKEINCGVSLRKRRYQVKTNLKAVIIVGCQAAKGKKSVARAIHELAPRASIFASKEKVSFTKIRGRYYPRYSKAYIFRHPWVLHNSPIKRVF